jgi:hypothetical protein
MSRARANVYVEVGHLNMSPARANMYVEGWPKCMACSRRRFFGYSGEAHCSLPRKLTGGLIVLPSAISALQFSLFILILYPGCVYHIDHIFCHSVSGLHK